MKCNDCGKILKKIDRRYEMAELDDDATEGQMADYFAALETDEWGDWGYGEIEYFCENCNSFCEVVVDSLNDLNSLIKGWHIKAKQQEDYFSKYVFQYLSFIAHIKNNLFMDERSDRLALQSFKRAEHLKSNYLKTISLDKGLKRNWGFVIKELGQRPLHNSSHDFDFPEIDPWWNSHENTPNRASSLARGVVHDFEDWGNMIEFWVAVRNNLFHGGKDPNIKRDQLLVKLAYETMSPFMDSQVK